MDRTVAPPYPPLNGTSRTDDVREEAAPVQTARSYQPTRVEPPVREKPPAPAPPRRPSRRLAQTAEDVRRNVPFIGTVFRVEDGRDSYVEYYGPDNLGSIQTIQAEHGAGDYFIEPCTEAEEPIPDAACEVFVADRRGGNRGRSTRGGSKPDPRVSEDLRAQIRAQERAEARKELERETRRYQNLLDSRDQDVRDAQSREKRARDEANHLRTRAMEAETALSQAKLAKTEEGTKHLAEIDRMVRDHQKQAHRLQSRLDEKTRELRAAEHLQKLAQDGIEIEESTWDRLVSVGATIAEKVDIGDLINRAVGASGTGAQTPALPPSTPALPASPPPPAETSGDGVASSLPPDMSVPEPAAASDAYTVLTGLAASVLDGDPDVTPDVFQREAEARAEDLDTDDWREIAASVLEYAVQTTPKPGHVAACLAPLIVRFKSPAVSAALMLPAKHATDLAIAAVGADVSASDKPYLVEVMGALKAELREGAPSE